MIPHFSRRAFCHGTLATLLSLLALVAKPAAACDSANPQVHSGNHITWCANSTFWAAHSSQIMPFFDYADRIVPQLTADFGFPVNEDFTIVVNAVTGAASTPTPYGPGVNVTGDAFYNVAYGVPGFYGYLFLVHEFVNQWTGLANGGGWPTDWWANHRSPFPNAIDSIVLRELGQTAAADAQAARWLPTGDSPDPEVVLFSNMFEDFGGWPFLQKYFAMIRSDQMAWSLKDPPNFQSTTDFVSGNPSPLLSNFVAAYFHLASQQNVKERFDTAGVGQTPPNWAPPPPFQPYALDANAIAGITTAHCKMLNADANSSAFANARTRFHLGDYAGALGALDPNEACSARCTDECACDADTLTCLPSYLVTRRATASDGNDAGGTAAGSETFSDSRVAGCAGCTSGSAPVAWLAGALALIARRRRRRF